MCDDTQSESSSVASDERTRSRHVATSDRFEKRRAAAVAARTLLAVHALFRWQTSRARSAFIAWRSRAQLSAAQKSDENLARAYRVLCLARRAADAWRRFTAFAPITRAIVAIREANQPANDRAVRAACWLQWRRQHVKARAVLSDYARAERFARALTLRRAMRQWAAAKHRVLRLRGAFAATAVATARIAKRALFARWLQVLHVLFRYFVQLAFCPLYQV